MWKFCLLDSAGPGSSVTQSWHSKQAAKKKKKKAVANERRMKTE